MGCRYTNCPEDSFLLRRRGRLWRQLCDNQGKRPADLHAFAAAQYTIGGPLPQAHARLSLSSLSPQPSPPPAPSLCFFP